MPTPTIVWLGGIAFQLAVAAYTVWLGRRVKQERLDMSARLTEAWAVIHECSKVIGDRDDFDSRHVSAKIRALAAKELAAVEGK